MQINVCVWRDAPMVHGGVGWLNVPQKLGRMKSR